MVFGRDDAKKLFKAAKVSATSDGLDELAQLLDEVGTDIICECFVVARRAGKKKITKADVQAVRKELLG